MKVPNKLGGEIQKIAPERGLRSVVKNNFLKENLKCPHCSATDFQEVDSSFICQGCSWKINSDLNQPLNFISDGQKERFNIVSTENVSAHPYDGNAMFLINKILDNGGWILDCGAGLRNFTHDRLVQVEVVNYPNVDVLAVNQMLPFRDKAFDVIFSLDVLEHVDDPFMSASEIKRILKPGGFLYVDIPFLQAEHGYPHHYFNATRQGLLKLFEDELEPQAHIVPRAGHPIAVLLQFLDVYLEQLPEQEAKKFLKMSVADIISKTHEEWMADPITQNLSTQGTWELASTTQAIFQKPLEMDGMLVENKFFIQQLPGFAGVPLQRLSFFNDHEYLNLYPDLAKASQLGQIDPWVHFLTYGLSEGRSPSAEIPFEAFSNDAVFLKAIEDEEFLGAANRMDQIAPFLKGKVYQPPATDQRLVYPDDFSGHPNHPLLTLDEAKVIFKDCGIEISKDN